MQKSPIKRDIQETLENVRSIMVDTVALQQQVDEITGVDTLRSSKRLSPRKPRSPKESPPPEPEPSSESVVEEPMKPETTSQLIARRFKLKPGTPKLKPRPTRRPMESPKPVASERSPMQRAILQLLEKQRLSPSQARLQRNMMCPSPAKNRTLLEQEEKSRSLRSQTVTPTKDFSSVSSSAGEAPPKPEPVKHEDQGSDMSIAELSSEENASPRSPPENKQEIAAAIEEEESVHEPQVSANGEDIEQQLSISGDEAQQPEDIAVRSSDSNKDEPEAPTAEADNTFVSDQTNSEEEKKDSDHDINIQDDDGDAEQPKEAQKSDDIDIDFDISD